MQLLPIKTRIIQPPQDDLFAVLDAYVTNVQERDVILISSKVVAIHQGRCVRANDASKQQLVQQEADVVIDRSYWKTPLTIKGHTFIGAAGIDESNANGYYVLLPKDMFAFAQQLHTYVREKHSVHDVGIIITDSHSQPMRFGATGIALAFYGIAPLQDHIGQRDLFGREMQVERSNIVDGLASGANIVSGEVAQCCPVVIARDVPNDIVFTDTSSADDLFVSFQDDLFRVLYERFLN